MNIAVLARQLGTTPYSIRFYERRGLIPSPERKENGYRDYTEVDAHRLRLLLGLRRLDLPLEQAAELATMCAAGRCDEVSDELNAAIIEKRAEIHRRMEELRFLDDRLAHLSSQLVDGAPPRSLIMFGSIRKEDGDGSL